MPLIMPKPRNLQCQQRSRRTAHMAVVLKRKVVSFIKGVLGFKYQISGWLVSQASGLDLWPVREWGQVGGSSILRLVDLSLKWGYSLSKIKSKECSKEALVMGIYLVGMNKNRCVASRQKLHCAMLFFQSLHHEWCGRYSSFTIWTPTGTTDVL